MAYYITGNPSPAQETRDGKETGPEPSLRRKTAGNPLLGKQSTRPATTTPTVLEPSRISAGIATILPLEDNLPSVYHTGMGNGMDSRSYRLIKWTWLLYQSSILPLSALYLSSPMSNPIIVPFSRIALYLLGAAFLVLWIMAQSLLSMFRFPLSTASSVRLVAAQFLQLVAIVAAGNSLTFAFYLSFFTSLAAIAILVLITSGWKLLTRPFRWLRALLFLVLAGLVFCLMGIFLGPLLSGFSELLTRQTVLDIAVLAANVGFTVRTLYGFSIFARPDKLDRSFDREWQRWAPATFILLTLSVIVAATIGGVRGM